MKNFHKMVTPPPPSCICEILIQIFNRKFRDKIKMRQNSVNNHQSHTKFRCSTRLMQWTSYLSFLTHQSILFWPKICHFEPLNFWIRVWKRADPPPPFVNKIHKTVLFFKGWLPLHAGPHCLKKNSFSKLALSISLSNKIPLCNKGGMIVTPLFGLKVSQSVFNLETHPIYRQISWEICGCVAN